jgi:DNA-binding response OmpR family regulator
VSGKKILIVDDDQTTVLALSAVLRKHGYETVAAADASMATTVARKEMPDLIILDMGLPGGNGLQLLRNLKTLLPLACTPVMMLTGSESLSLEREVLAAGAEAFFQKPVVPDVFMATVRHALGE